MRQYPNTLSEDETLDRVVAGASLSRWGDGEWKILRGAGIKSQEFHPGLQRRIRDALTRPGKCLVGIPNIRSKTPKSSFWSKYRDTARLLPDASYASSFVTRPDSAPWIDRPDYWAKVESLWRDREVTLVRGSTKSLTAEMLVGAARVVEVVGPRQHAWASYDELLEAVGRPERAILCLGPTATVMAVDLCARGVHAIDLGHVGMFLRKFRRGDAMVVTEEDKRS